MAFKRNTYNHYLSNKNPQEQTDIVNKNVSSEQFAKNSLLQISSQEFQMPLDYITPPARGSIEKSKSYSVKKYVKTTKISNESAIHRMSVTQNLGKSHQISRMPIINYVAGQQVVVMKKERILNLSHFLILEKESFKNNNCTKNNFNIESNSLINRMKPSRNVLSLLKRRNLSAYKNLDLQNVNNKEQDVSLSPKKKSDSPEYRINISCDLSEKTDFYANQKPLEDSNQIQQKKFINTSPTFRNKKCNQYFRYRCQPKSN